MKVGLYRMSGKTHSKVLLKKCGSLQNLLYFEIIGSICAGLRPVDGSVPQAFEGTLLLFPDGEAEPNRNRDAGARTFRVVHLEARFDGKVDTHEAPLTLFIESAEANGVPVPAAETLREYAVEAVAQGLAKEDYSVVVKMLMK